MRSIIVRALHHVRSQWTGPTYHCLVCGRMSIHPTCAAGCPRSKS